METETEKTTKTTETATEKKPGNISADQLGAMLSKSSQSRNANLKPGAAGAATAGKKGAAAGETQQDQNGPGTEEQPADLTQTVSDPPEGETTEEANAAGAKALTEGAGASGAEADAGKGGEAEAGKAKAELPAELAEAITALKAAGNKGAADLLKRVHTVVDQRDTERMGRLNAERELQTTQAQLEELKKNPQQQPAAPVTGDPVNEHPEVVKVARELAEVDAYLDFCEANPDGGTLPDGKGGEVEFGPDKIKLMKRNAERMRQEMVSRKTQVTASVGAAHQQAYSQMHAQAVKTYPWLENKTAPEHVEMRQFLQMVPALRAFPDHEFVIGDYIRGRQARMAADKAAAAQTKKPVNREPARVVTEPPAGGRKAGGAEEGGADGKEQKQFERSGTTTDLAKTFAARHRARAGR